MNNTHLSLVNITGVTTDGTDLDAERTPTTPVLTPQRVTYQRYELPADEEPLPNSKSNREPMNSSEVHFGCNQ